MATANHNLSEYDKTTLPDSSEYKIAFVVSEWNNDITFNLLKGAKDTLLDCGINNDNILVEFVPGTYELAFGAQTILEKHKNIDSVITIGCVIQGETRHFEFVASSTSNNIQQVSLKYNKPVIFCVLTDNNHNQSVDRAGGKLGNKGIEAAITALKMIEFYKK